MLHFTKKEIKKTCKNYSRYIFGALNVPNAHPQSNQNFSLAVCQKTSNKFRTLKYRFLSLLPHITHAIGSLGRCSMKQQIINALTRGGEKVYIFIHNCIFLTFSPSRISQLYADALALCDRLAARGR